MHCPTCNSPLPVGAMFCGECGRAVTSADVAAAAAADAAAAASAARQDESRDAEVQAEPPAWQLRQPPRQAPSGEAPWWVRDRQGEQGADRQPAEQATEEAPPAWAAPVESPVASQPVTPAPVAPEPVATASPEPVVPGAVMPPPPAPENVTPEPVTSEPVTTEPVAPEPVASIVDREAAARARQSDVPVVESTPAAPVPPPAPTPLRVPATHQDNGPRPTSAPLWTASLAPLPTEDGPTPRAEEPADATAAPAAEAADSAADRDAAGTADASDEHAPEPEADSSLPQGVAVDAVDAQAEGPSETRSVDDGQSPAADGDPVAPTGQPVDASTPDIAPDPGPAAVADQPVAPTPVADSAPAPDSAESPDRASAAGPTPPVPLRTPVPEAVAGDTAPVTPLPRVGPVGSAGSSVPSPAPVPLVEPGQQKVVEHCTHCGALLHEDDIFCPECGAVVQSVALSFTGPIAPLPPEWRPNAQAPAPGPAPVAAAAPRAEPRPQAQPDPGGPVEGEPADDQPAAGGRDDAAERQPEPPVARGAIPGFPTASPRGASPAAPPELPPMPAAAAPSALSGLLSQDERARLATDDDVDETRLVRRGPAGTEYLLQFSTGESVTVDGSGLIGRAPSPQPGERFDQLVRIVDPGKSVSKTHLEFGQERGALWVSDRWSGNGTVVRPRDQPARRVEPGTRVRVARGTRVEIGEQFFIVS